MNNKELLVVITNDYEEEIHYIATESKFKLKPGEVLTIIKKVKELKRIETYHGSISEDVVKTVTDEENADGIVTTMPILVIGDGNAKLFEAGEYSLVYKRDYITEVAFDVDAVTTVYIDLDLLKGKYVFVKEGLPALSLEEKLEEDMKELIDSPITFLYQKLKELGELHFVFQYESRGRRNILFSLIADNEEVNFKVRVGWNSVKGFEIVKDFITDTTFVNMETGESFDGYCEIPYLIGERVVFDKVIAEEHNASALAYSKVNTGTIINIDPNDQHGLVLEVRPDDWEPSHTNFGILIGHVPLHAVMPDQ